ncbi:MAG: hypothetical protein P4L63_03610 [Candidatus Pacebacteria bacterium]|nr:hypothetical protein [Candidatus Paceibacterota bacterium]
MEKIKQFLGSEKGKDILTVLIVILVGFGSFMLGRLSKENPQTQPSEETSNNQNANASSADITGADVVRQNTNAPDVGIPQGGSLTPGTSSAKPFFASSKGKKYYTANCSAGKTIKPANLIYFDTEAAAQKAGYTLSSSC